MMAMARTLALVLGLALGTVATAAMAQQQTDIMSKPRSTVPGGGIPSLTSPGGAGTTGTGTPGTGSTGAGSSGISSTPGGSISMGAGTQNAPRRPSLGPDYGNSLIPPRD